MRGGGGVVDACTPSTPTPGREGAGRGGEPGGTYKGFSKDSHKRIQRVKESNKVKHINKHLTYIYTLRAKESYITTYTQFIGMYDSLNPVFKNGTQGVTTWRRGGVSI